MPLRRQNAISIESSEDEDEIPPKSIDEIIYKFTPPVIVIDHPLMTSEEILQKVKSEKVEDQIAVCQSTRKRNPHIEDIIKKGVLKTLVEYLKRSDRIALQLEAASAITDVVSGNSDRIRAVATHGAVPPLIEMLRSEYHDVAEQALLALGNIARGGPDLRDFVMHSCETCHFVVHVIPLLVKLLEISAPEMLMVVLNGLHNILECAQKLGNVEKIAQMIEETGGVDKLEELQSHENTNVYNKALQIIMLFFSLEEEEDTENNASSTPSTL